MNYPAEPHVVINGVTLNKAQCMSLRSAVKEFSLTLRTNVQSDDAKDNLQTAACLLRLRELESLFSMHLS